MKRLLWTLLVAALIAVGTWGLDWWIVPAVGALTGVALRTDRLASVIAGLGAALGWGGLLAFTLSRAAGTPLETIAPVLRMTPDRLVWVTLAFAALLGASAAALSRALLTRPPTPGPTAP
jgi:hypothetical protein